MNDADALLRAILADPADDLPRLMYADEIEADEPEWAEFIRVQCELPKLEAFAANRALYSGDSLPGDKTDQLIALRRRERELLEWFAAEDLAVDLGLSPHETLHVTGSGWICPRLGAELTPRRGFVSHVSCDLAAFAGGPCGRCRETPGMAPYYGSTCPICSGAGRNPGAAKALFAAQPVTAVTLTDREPTRILGGYSWSSHPGQTNTVPDCILTDYFDYGPHPTREAAIAYLSGRLVEWGRGLAGLPPLKPTETPK